MMQQRFFVFAVGSVLCALLASQTLAVENSQGNWPRFRGPDGSGVASDPNAPTSWSADSLTWKVDLPVEGHSSPILWGESIFLSGSKTAANGVTRHVVCIDRNNGKVVWERQVAEGPGESVHKMNGRATPSCATDGERVVAFFGAGGLHCLDAAKGTLLWSQELGGFPGAWGVGASPVIVGELVIQNCDAQGTSFLLAVDKRSGETVWRQTRREKPRGGWSTPIVIEHNGSQQIVVNGEFGVEAYDIATGKPLWFCKSTNGRGTPAPIWGRDKIYVVCGKSGNTYAVKPGGSGDVTDTHIVWAKMRRGGRDLPSPVLANDLYLVVNMAGIITGYNSDTGDELWRERLGGNFSGSPVVINGKVYLSADNGDVHVLAPSKTAVEQISRNSLGATDEEVFRSSIAVSDGQVFLRSNKRLYCMGNRGEPR